MRHRIGLVADVQYADIDDTWDFFKIIKRRYRATLLTLRNAVSAWQEEKNKVDLVVDLGDAIDGFKNETKEQGNAAMTQIMEEWAKLSSQIPVLHLIGNHELYKFTRDELRNGAANTTFTCCCPPNLAKTADSLDSFYYTFMMGEQSPWRVVVLDPYAVSVLGNGGGRYNLELTLENGGLDRENFELCQRNNPNDLLSGGDFFREIEGLQARWVPFNGGLGSEQLVWLESVLKQSYNNDEKVIVLSHVIIHPDATPRQNCHTLLWDFEKVLSLFQHYPCVRMVLAGHAHYEGYHYCPETKVHHVSLPSPLEAPTKRFSETTFATLEISADDMHGKIMGSGWIRSMDLDFY